MPIGPTHRKPAARPDFVGRKKELELVSRFLKEAQPMDEYRILSFHGIGGQGKTTLLDQVTLMLGKKDYEKIPTARLDFHQVLHRDPATALIELRNQVRSRSLRTNAFDIAYARYFALTHSGRDIREDHPELFKFGDNSLLAQLTEIAGSAFLEIPGGKLVYSLLSRLSGNAVEWYKKRGSEILQQLEDFRAQELQAALPMFFGYDLCTWSEDNPQQRPVLLFDTYEDLWKGRQVGATGSGDTNPSAWLRQLVEEAPGALVIVAGRRPVAWERIDPDWEVFIISHSLDVLDKPEQLALLDSVGIEETAIRQRILETAKGHPLSIRAQIRIYEKIRQRNGVPHSDDFPSTQKEVLDRLLDHMDPLLRGILRALAAPNIIHRNLWAHFSRSGFSMFDVYAPEDVFGEVGFRAVSEDQMVIHERVREHILAELKQRDPDFLKRARLAVFEFYDKASSQDASRRREVGFEEESLSFRDHDQRFREAAEQLLAAAPERFSSWSLDRLANDVSPGGSRMRKWILQQARSHLGAIDAKSAVPAIGIAKLEIEGNPFSDEGGKLLERALNYIGDNIDAETSDALVKICWNLLNAGDTSHVERLERALETRQVRQDMGLALGLRLANLRRNLAKQRTLLNAHLDELAEKAPWEVLVSIANLGEHNLLTAYLGEVGASEQDDEHRLHLMRLLDAFLHLKRPDLAIETASWFYGSRNPEVIAEKATYDASGAFRGRAMVLLAEVFGSLPEDQIAHPHVKYRHTTYKLATTLLTEEKISQLRQMLRQWPREQVGSDEWWDGLRKVEAETGLGGLLRRLVKLLPSEELERVTEGSELEQSGWAYLRSEASPSLDDALYLAVGEKTYPLSPRFKEKLGNKRAELVVNEHGQVFLFIDEPFLCWRESDFALIQGSELDTLYFYDGGTGWGDFGIKVDERLRQNYGQGFKLLLVYMDANAGNPLEGKYLQVYFSHS